MSGGDHEGEPLTASALLAWWESLRRPGEPERLPLEPGSLYEIDREGSVFRVSPPRPPERLKAFDLKTAEKAAAKDWDFDPKPWKRLREGPPEDFVPIRYLYRSVPPCTLVYGPAEDRWTQAVRLPSAEDRKPLPAEDSPSGAARRPRAWAGGAPLPAVGDTDRGWFQLTLGDGASLLFHGPSRAAEVFGRHREASARHRSG